MEILIIKFAALGDVLRTTPLLTGLRKRYPHSRISWLTEKESADILKGNHLIDEICIFDGRLGRLKKKNFDLLVNLDKDKDAVRAAEEISAGLKKGFGQDGSGSLRPFDEDSQYAYRMGIDDQFKFRRNNKTYQQISFEQVGLDYNREEYIFNLDKEDIDFAQNKLLQQGLRPDMVKVGIATGRGSSFCGKSLAEDYYLKIIDLLNLHDNIQVLLLGGWREVDKNKRIEASVKRRQVDTGCDNTIGQYAAIVNLCDLVLTGDTLTLHLGIALKKLMVVFFGSTAQQEIDLYGRGSKLLPEIDCSPCYKRSCPRDEECLKQITPKRVVGEIERLLKENGKI